jgi:hypothetical protein
MVPATAGSDHTRRKSAVKKIERRGLLQALCTMFSSTSIMPCPPETEYPNSVKNLKNTIMTPEKVSRTYLERNGTDSGDSSAGRARQASRSLSRAGADFFAPFAPMLTHLKLGSGKAGQVSREAG